MNSSRLIADQMLASMGIGLLPTYLVGEHPKSGWLVPRLQGYQLTVNSGLYALYQPNRYVTAKVSRFIDLLKTSFQGPLSWDAAPCKS